MTAPVLIVRPEPGSSDTARRARALGLAPITTPIFTIAPVDWEAPEADAVDAVLLTSANAARCAGPELRRFTHLPCYAVGESTAAEAASVGFRDVRTGPSDGAAVAALMASDGVRTAFHPCGRDHIPLGTPGLRLERRLVYQSDSVTALPEEASGALQKGALVLIHSPRAGAQFARLIEAAGAAKERIALAAISDAAASAAGDGWKAKAVAPYPRDHALLELAAKLCKTGAPG
ncbi:MAG TPA: uroporphyrinogen-III synthase, partial [Allosphingosinicella sp.]|nr:uroporphyrinogen-III synthase [Allosphingosinicella sp.]